MYNILPYSYHKAHKLGVTIKPSNKLGKKIDVFTNEKRISIGDSHFPDQDYPHYMKNYGKDYANERRRLYNIRHKNDSGNAGYFAKHILW